MSHKNVVVSPEEVNTVTKQAALLGDISAQKSQLACSVQEYWSLMKDIHGADSSEAVTAHQLALEAKHEAVKAVNKYLQVNRVSEKMVEEYIQRANRELAKEIACAAIGHAMRGIHH